MSNKKAGRTKGTSFGSPATPLCPSPITRVSVIGMYVFRLYCIVLF